MIKDYLIEKNKLILHTYSRIVIYADENGEVHQDIILYVINDTPIWSRHSP